MSGNGLQYTLVALFAFLAICLTCLQMIITVKVQSIVVLYQTPCSVKLECRNDSFNTLVMPHDGSIIKWAFIKTLPEGEKLSFNRSKEHCVNQSAELWQVKNKIEWEEITKHLKSLDVWLDGQVDLGEDGFVCPSGKECRKNEAQEGYGVPVRWGNESSNLSNYSRLYRGETSEKKCIHVEEATRLWSIGYCDLEEHFIVCIKRDCL